MENNIMPNSLKLLRAKEVAAIMDISLALAYRLMQTGVIPTVRVNTAVRVLPEDLEAYIRSSRAGTRV